MDSSRSSYLSLFIGGTIDVEGLERWDQSGWKEEALDKGSMKFPVALQSTRAVVAMVLTPYCSQMGNRIAHSDLFATSTEVMTEEEDIVTTS